MKMGSLTETRLHDNTVAIEGQICDYSIPNMRLKLEQNNNRTKEESPTHNVLARAPHGGIFQAGVAWFGSDKNGKPMYSIKLNIPQLSAMPLEYCAFERETGAYDIVASTPQQQAA